ncbi:OmpA family protein [Cyclobacterium qasimii]|uniref:OmpA/MotB domain protein n=2 Tax=Cyclobacterium qasimii TaxID=1350429 RepID=S7V5Z5_9BACT|nr:OmpA family protein [Cyclobacterium qasimii]EPR65605.1 OmpA/MotB domain protein [Cyclobacterium qasimii M12-11B]GEO19551.1 hypothetical protein CQA01_00850 [Cyclobacterium qasimii]
MNKTFVILLRASTILVLALFVIHKSEGQTTELKRIFSLEYDEQQPLLAPDGSLYFTLAFHPNNKGGKRDSGDIWFAPKKEGVFMSPQSVPEISTPYYDLLIGFIDENIALVYHANLNNQQVIQRYKWSGVRWSRDEPMQLPGFKTKGDYFSAALDPSGSYMVLSMDSYGSYGNEDIYVSKRNGNSWTRPLNLGTTLNTASQELSPAITLNGDTLYFSTNASDSEKSIEIYFSKRLDDSWGNWSKPELLGFSEMAGMDMYYLPDRKNGGFFYTNTQTSDGFGNIYFNGKASMQSTNSFLEQRNNLGNEPETIIIDSSAFAKNEAVIPTNNGVNSNTESPLEKSIGGTLSKNLDTLAAGKGLVLEDLLFQRGSVELVNKESLTILDELSVYLMENPEKIISIEGHTDSYGNEGVNARLSLARANKIKDLLLEKGIPEVRLLTKGWGGKKPIATNSNLAGRIKNRRVEIFVLTKD